VTPDVLDRLRASNPLPDGSTAPELESLLRRLDTVARGPRRFRPFRLLVPVLGVAVALLVLIGALGVLHAGHRGAVSRRHVPAPPPTVPLAPRGGMRGLVLVVGAGFSSSSDGVISVQQCLGCLDDGNQTPHSRDLYWLARTVDGGRNWSLTRERYSLQRPLFVGQNGWAGGLEATGPQAGGVAEYYVTHDGGRTWSVAPAAAPNQGGALVSIGGNEVWATGLTPTNVTIMHALVAGDRLSATASQPIHGGSTNVQVIAGRPGTAYVSNADAPRQTFVTHDDGRSWQRIQPACPSGEGGELAAAYGDTLWAECYSTRSQRQVLSRSDNGGSSWQQLHPRLAPSIPPQPVSTEAAWALSGHKVLRTTNRGLTWSAVWSAANSQPPSLRSQTPPPIAAGSNLLLIANSPTSASLVTAITRGHVGDQTRLTNLVVYRTADGGQTWQPYVVSLGMR
jgi:photosystem II stability/assembly factor-like uncharacterized protein